MNKRTTENWKLHASTESALALDEAKLKSRETMKKLDARVNFHLGRRCSNQLNGIVERKLWIISEWARLLVFHFMNKFSADGSCRYNIFFWQSPNCAVMAEFSMRHYVLNTLLDGFFESKDCVSCKWGGFRHILAWISLRFRIEYNSRWNESCVTSHIFKCMSKHTATLLANSHRKWLVTRKLHESHDFREVWNSALELILFEPFITCARDCHTSSPRKFITCDSQAIRLLSVPIYRIQSNYLISRQLKFRNLSA